MAAEESTVAFATVKSCSLQKNAMETPFDMIFALATSKNVCFMLDFRGVLFGHGDFFHHSEIIGLRAGSECFICRMVDI
jgi:hypothetical protein